MSESDNFYNLDEIPSTSKNMDISSIFYSDFQTNEYQNNNAKIDFYKNQQNEAILQPSDNNNEQQSYNCSNSFEADGQLPTYLFDSEQMNGDSNVVLPTETDNTMTEEALPLMQPPATSYSQFYNSSSLIDPTESNNNNNNEDNLSQLIDSNSDGDDDGNNDNNDGDDDVNYDNNDSDDDGNNYNNDLVNNSDNHVNQNRLRGMLLFGKTKPCYRCCKLYDMNYMFVYSEDESTYIDNKPFICIWCSLHVNNANMLRDWDIRPVKGTHCYRCNCDRSECRFKKRKGKKSSYCSYCSLKKKRSYLINKNRK